MPLDKVLYTAKTQTAGGRDGASHSDDGLSRLETPFGRLRWRLRDNRPLSG